MIVCVRFGVSCPSIAAERCRNWVWFSAGSWNDQRLIEQHGGSRIGGVKIADLVTVLTCDDLQLASLIKPILKLLVDASELHFAQQTDQAGQIKP